jgi:hypothetical protein
LPISFWYLHGPFGFFFQAIALLALPAKCPYDALLPELAISAGICAGFAVVETFLTVTDLHFLAVHSRITIRVKSAFHVLPLARSLTSARFDPRQFENYEKQSCYSK